MLSSGISWSLGVEPLASGTLGMHHWCSDRLCWLPHTQCVCVMGEEGAGAGEREGRHHSFGASPPGELWYSHVVPDSVPSELFPWLAISPLSWMHESEEMQASFNIFVYLYS